MQCEIFLTAMAVHLMAHRLKDFGITSDWANGEEFHYDATANNGDSPTDKQVVSLCLMRREECISRMKSNSCSGTRF